MSTKIGIISDPHATPGPVAEAMSIFRRAGVEHILCAGDIAGYGDELNQTIALLRENDCSAILGNHDVWYMERTVDGQTDQACEYFRNLPGSWESVVEGVNVYAAHASPPQSMSRGIRLLDEHGKMLPDEQERWTGKLQGYPFDVLIVGHTHQVFAEWLGDKLVINPGSTSFNHTDPEELMLSSRYYNIRSHQHLHVVCTGFLIAPVQDLIGKAGPGPIEHRRSLSGATASDNAYPEINIV